MPDLAPATRADARRNRQAILATARRVFAEQGIQASLDEIAQRANVGNATLYRHFGSRCQLVAAALSEQMEKYAQLAAAAAADPDPWKALRGYLTTLCRMQAADRGLADLLTSDTFPDPAIDAARDNARRDVVRAIRRAQRAGALRADFAPQDIAIILMANAGLIHRAGAHAQDSSARLIALLLDGLQATAATPAPPPPSEPELLTVMRGERRGEVRDR
ncbi:TetR/AcrR family transcriptional regulator [Frankia sp. QA3]|uniref:TetR/AcrR family transcriptional regulator n=1 Tax=Frankia sp. QA3 TaxID=710111 RepID=UPI000269CB97|nr:TetR/AcrR family transcriptional regulator [Frankia sp. QA3]EIV95456.1 transcriptional regulator [Frankia sp. QA3]